MNHWQVGDSRSFTKTITETDVVMFAGISGDMNPLHTNAEYAARTRFGQRIAHGAILQAYISNVIGNQLPGDGAIYLSSSVRFQKPSLIGDTVRTTCTIKHIRQDKAIFTLECTCTNQREEVVLSGESVILYEPLKLSL